MTTVDSVPRDAVHRAVHTSRPKHDSIWRMWTAATFPWMGWQTSVADAAETKEGTTAWKATQEGEGLEAGRSYCLRPCGGRGSAPGGRRGPHQPRPVERRRTDDGSLNTSYTAAADEAVR